MKKLFALLLAAGISPLFAQVSTPFHIAPGGVSSTADSSVDYFPALQIIEADHADDEANPRIKDSLAAIYRNRPQPAAQRSSNPQSAVVVAPPTIGNNFAGNAFNNSTPNDNAVAIANNGHLVSVQNSTIFRYRTATNVSNNLQSLALWASSLGNSNSKYDPKVIYDPEANRFIVVCLAGYLSNATNIIIGFSKTDSCNGAYNLYSIPGNPFSDSLWTDYPAIAVNGDELFVTVNLLHDNQSWQLGFVQTVIWQLNKWDGYNGDTLRTELHSGINYNGRPIRNLCPVAGGDYVAPGHGLYFLSERNLDAMNDTVFLVHVTDTANSPAQQVIVTALVSSQSYFMPADASEPSGGPLASNDSRILGAFIQNNRIQYVGNTMDTTTGYCAIYHGIISNVSTSPTQTGHIISSPSLEYGYPNIAYMGMSPTDNTAIISFLHTDTTTFPGTSALTTDGNGNYSAPILVKAGLGYIDLFTNSGERWGDYSGIQRKYDVGGTCWVNGMYGLANHYHATWITQLGVTPDVGMQQQTQPETQPEIFPNPFVNSIQVVFNNNQQQHVRFVLYDMNGREVQSLMDDYLPVGKMQFSFSTGPLSQGVYLLRAETDNGSVLFTQRVVKN